LLKILTEHIVDYKSTLCPSTFVSIFITFFESSHTKFDFFLAPIEVTAATNFAKSSDEDAIDRFYKKEPNVVEIRQYLSTDRKRHLTTLSRSEKVVVGRQAKRFRLSPDGSLQCSEDGTRWLIYPDTSEARQQILSDMHRYSGMICSQLIMFQIICYVLGAGVMAVEI